MNFDFKNVQRRVYDALNVLNALDMVKKDRNKIEFVRDIQDVFGDSRKYTASTPDKSHNSKIAENQEIIRKLREKKSQMLQSLSQKKQYFEEITVQAALLKKLVRRNYLDEEEGTTKHTPNKANKDDMSVTSELQSLKVHLPVLILAINKKASFEVLMSEDHKEVVVVSDKE